MVGDLLLGTMVLNIEQAQSYSVKVSEWVSFISFKFDKLKVTKYFSLKVYLYKKKQK